MDGDTGEKNIPALGAAIEIENMVGDFNAGEELVTRFSKRFHFGETSGQQVRELHRCWRFDPDAMAAEVQMGGIVTMQACKRGKHLPGKFNAIGGEQPSRPLYPQRLKAAAIVAGDRRFPSS